MRIQFSSFAAATAVWLCAPAMGAAQPKAAVFTKEELKQYFALEGKLDADKRGHYRKLLEMFPKQETFTAAEVTAVTNPKTTGPRTYDIEDYEQKGSAPLDTFTPGVAKAHFALIERRDPKKKSLYKALLEKYRQQDWYTAEQLRDVEGNGAEPEEIPKKRAFLDPVAEAVTRGSANEYQAHEGFRSPKIRHDWGDVLYDEDPSQISNMPKQIGDLVGAQLSYTHDGKANSDTWSAQGALILPYVRHYESTGHFGLTAFAAAPSVTVNRISTNGDPAVEADTVFYRLGVYMDFFGLMQGPRPDPTGNAAANALAKVDSLGDAYGVQVRAAGVYVSDFQNEAGLRGYEADIEPRWLNKVIPLGYRNVIIRKEPLKPDGTDDSILECQLRAWLHMEGGQVQDVGPAWIQTAESFFRLGPVVEFKLLMPALPGDRALSLTALYSYLSAVSGPTEREWYFRSTLAYDLYRRPDLNHKVSINIDYQRGGLNFTKEEVDTLTIGLGILF